MTPRAELDGLAEMISRAVGEPHAIGYAYGRPRLERAGGSVDVSPRLPAGELARWMRAFLAGVDAGRSAGFGPVTVITPDGTSLGRLMPDDSIVVVGRVR